MSEPSKPRWWRRPWVWVVLVAVAGLVTFALIDEVEPPDKLVLPTYIVSPLGLAESNPGFGEYYRAHVDAESLTLSNFTIGAVDVVDADGRVFYRAQRVQLFMRLSIMLMGYTIASEYETFAAMEESLKQNVSRLVGSGCVDADVRGQATERRACPAGSTCCSEALPDRSMRFRCPTTNPRLASVSDFDASLSFSCSDGRFTVLFRTSMSLGDFDPGRDGRVARDLINEMASETGSMLR